MPKRRGPHTSSPHCAHLPFHSQPSSVHLSICQNFTSSANSRHWYQASPPVAEALPSCLSNERRTVLGHSRGGTHFRKHARPWLKLLDAGDIDPLMSRGPRRATDKTDPAIVARSQGATGSAPAVARQRLVTVSVAPTAGLLDWRTSRARGALAARLRLLQEVLGRRVREGGNRVEEGKREGGRTTMKMTTTIMRMNTSRAKGDRGGSGGGGERG